MQSVFYQRSDLSLSETRSPFLNKEQRYHTTKVACLTCLDHRSSKQMLGFATTKVP